MDELVPGTMRVKHKLIPQIPFIIINETDFNSDIHEKIIEQKVDEPVTFDNKTVDQAEVVETNNNPELPPDVIKVKHKLINVPFIVINKSDFDPEIHSLFVENSSIAAGNDSVSADDNSIATSDDSVPAGDDSVSAGDDSIAAGNDSVSADDNSITTDDNSESEANDKTRRGRKKALTE
jgi:hypothetical protein